METILRLTLEHPAAPHDRWNAIAQVIRQWAQSRAVDLRDAVVLLPFAQLLPLARCAFAQDGGWMPRIETTRTLARGLGPAEAPLAGQLSFDPAIDLLTATALLRSQSWSAGWARRDPRAMEHGARALTAAAHAMAQAAFALPPDERPAHWELAREALTPIGGPGSIERLLTRVALEWACFAPAPATDRLFTLAPPSAWIAVQAGGLEPLTARLMTDTAVPCLLLDTDACVDDPFAALGAACAPACALCDDFEHEAQCASAQVLLHLQRGEWPVALIAQDRLLMRRVRALLERCDVRLLDETGWKLSTTRAAARVMTLLRAAARTDAGTDLLFDWLKTGTAWTRADSGAALSELETACRRQQIARIAGLQRAELGSAAARLRSSAIRVLTALTAAGRRPLKAWLAALRDALAACGALDALRADEAGRQVLTALRLVQGQGVGRDRSSAADQQPAMDIDAFRDWIDGVLERATFLPGALHDEAAEVIITPLARAMLRPFAAVVFAGADERRLGAPPAVDGLLGDAQAAALGMPTSAQRRSDELLAFVQILAAPRLTFMRRRIDGAEPLADSPLVARLALALAARGRALAAWSDPRVERSLVPTPLSPGAPVAAALLPTRLSASACEALRACPYRFFALYLLRLREDDELDREIDKRDYGTWLHAVLFEFHSARDGSKPANPAATEIAQLLALGDSRNTATGIAEADFLPFGASFASFAPRYVAWLQERERTGACWQRGEETLSAWPDELDGVEIYGVIDRIDELRSTTAGATIQMIDYKTGNAAALKARLKEPLEDTQLAFYAALMRAHTDLPLVAGYLAVDSSKSIVEIPHPQVEHSAAALVQGLAGELRRLRGGSGLHALGEGATCEYCAARGVCRRDHWATDSGEPAAAPAQPAPGPPGR